MCRHRPVTSALLGLCFAALANLAPQPVAAAPQAQIPALAPGMARGWFLRPAGSLSSRSLHQDRLHCHNAARRV